MLRLEHGALRVEAPLTAEAALRVQIGVEQPYNEAFDVEIAPEMWMSSPRVRIGFEGLLLDAALTVDGRLSCEARTCATLGVEVLERASSLLGRLQQPRTTSRAARAVLESGAGPEALLPAGTTSAEPAVIVSFGPH